MGRKKNQNKTEQNRSVRRTTQSLKHDQTEHDKIKNVENTHQASEPKISPTRSELPSKCNK